MKSNQKSNTCVLLGKSFLAIVILLLFVSIGVAICINTKPSATESRVIQGITIWLAAIAFLGYQKLRGRTMKEFGICSMTKEGLKNIYYCIPAIVLSSLSYIEGLNKEGVVYILASFFMAAGVGLEEELCFRGYIFNIWKGKGDKIAIIVTSVLFGVTHVANIMSGQNWIATILQIIFAFSYGMVFTMMYLLGKSLWPCIFIHFFHNFSSFICDESNLKLEYGISAVQTVLMVIYVVMMILRYKKMQDEKVLENVA